MRTVQYPHHFPSTYFTSLVRTDPVLITIA